MQKLFYSRTRNRRGFNLIELIVVIAIVGIMVMIAAPKFFGYTNDSRVAAMKTDAKILSGAAAMFHIDNKEWPIGAEAIKGAGLEAVIGDTAVYEIDGDALDPYVKNIKGEYSDYGIITTGEMEGEVVHLSGVTAKDETVWFGTDLNSDSLPVDEPVDYAVCAAGVYLATDEDFEGDADGEFHYIGTETEVRIPHVIKGVEVTSYYEMFSVYEGATDGVTKVVSDNPNVTDMSYMFEWSTAESIDLSCFDTSGVTNMEEMFNGVEATSVDFSNWDTSKVTNMYQMFRESQITTLDLSNFDTSSVEDMSAMFAYSEATTIDISGFDTSNVIYMYSMFEESKATTLDLSSFDTSNVTDMNWMFAYSQATTIDVSSFDTSNVTNMDWMFAVTLPETLDLSHFDTSNVVDMHNMFDSAAATLINMSGWDTSNVTDMRNMFHSTNMTTLDVSSFDTANVLNMASMFENTIITTLDLSSWDVSNVTDLHKHYPSYTTNMFKDSLATICYARSQADADKLSASSNKPIGLTFIVQ